LRHLEKPIREVFADICDDKLTNLEIDKFIKKSTDRFKLPKLKRLIVDYELYIQRERPELLIYFEYLYGDREKFVTNGKVADQDTVNKIIKEYEKKYKNSPEFIHSDYEEESQDIEDFSPFMNEYTTANKDPEQSVAITSYVGTSLSLHNEVINLAIMHVEPTKRKYLWVLAPIIMSSWTLLRMNSKTFNKSINKLKKHIILESSEKIGTGEKFTEDLKLFLDSPTYHFNVKLHTLYKNLKTYGKQNQNESEPTEKYDTNVSPDNVDKSSEISHADKIKKYDDNYWESAHELYYDGGKWEDVYNEIEKKRSDLGLNKKYANFPSFKRGLQYYRNP